ncbi:hypothetical protein HAX54_039715 [Datura stramonium]|uniref:Uncharacterized protein n=1 Tax=Datura stramonium TaxID=4076 RepID=A0ABS8SKB8_DATST|nr:hypothetical protein [Datura stramonium]
MASHKVFIDLVDNEAKHQDFESRQDKVTSFEASMECFPESMSKSHFAAPVHTVSRLAFSTALVQNAQEGSSLYSLALQKSLDGLAGMPKNEGIPNPLCKDFDPNKHRTFHSVMQGHDTNVCRHLKEEIRKLIISGRISQRPHPQLIWYQPPEIISTSNYTPIYHPPLTMKPPVQTMWYLPPTIAPTSHYIPTPYPKFIAATYPHNQATMPRTTKK